MNIVIDPEFKELIPPLTDDEFKQLDANLLRDGCKEPLTVWDGILIDGHNRYDICQQHSIKFKVDEIKFKSRDHAMAWIDERQLGRRNLDDDKRAMVADDLVQRLSKIAVVEQRWGFQYKASFVWDKVRHNMGFYNSVRHELLLIATKGSCKPDIPKLVDSVQSIERSAKHSEKPQEFYAIIEGMYDHGRKLELFSRSAREGWDSDGDESDHARKAA